MFKIGTSSVAAGNLISQALTSAASKASEFATFAYRAAEATGQWAENIGFLADRTGLSEEFLIGMEPALNRVKLTADDLALGFRRLAVNVQESGDAGSKASLLFERLGINIEQLSNRAVGQYAYTLVAINDFTAAQQEHVKTALDEIPHVILTRRYQNPNMMIND